VAAALAAAAVVFVPACGPGATPPPPAVVATTSMLAEAARELLAGVDGVRIVTVISPGGCPGHFDLPPGIASDLRTARAVLCHDYQSTLQDRLATLGAPAGALVTAATPGSLLIPEHFAALIRQSADGLAARLPDRASRIEANARAAETRLAARSEALRKETAARPWAGARVVVSRHQQAFARWLGLSAAHVLQRPEDLAPQDLSAALAAPADLVVANLQEGTQAADAVARERRLPVAVFSNFPGAPGYGATYEDLLRANLRRLDEAWAARGVRPQ
jgi:ABC-type Zn uptake system ZnuABC Zn-binding protein ZnuA